MTKSEARQQARKLREQGIPCRILKHSGVTTCAVRRQIISYCYYSVEETGTPSAKGLDQ